MGFAIGANLSGNYVAPGAVGDEGKGFALGDQYEGHDAKRYVFVQASTSVASYNAVVYDTAGVAQNITSALALTGVRVGVAQNSISSGSYGWVQIYGACSVNALSTCSANSALYASGTTGSIDDTGTASTKIVGLILTANITAAAVAAGVLSTEAFVSI